MNASQTLLERIRAFEFDEPGTQLTFVRRLARENGWTLPYAERVVVEYKRFLYLACTAGHIVTPSEQVDQAWHLHLTYTRSYWEDLCRGVLGKPLHHGPTRGGSEEQAKYIDLYLQTLESYRNAFGAEPPSDIWSPVDERFGEDLHHVNVNTDRYWIIPKPRLPKVWRGRMPMMALVLAALPLAGFTWNPLDWNGPQFLTLFVSVAIVAALMALAVRLLFTGGDETPAKPVKLDPYEAACLAAGPARAVQAAFASLVQAGTLEIVSEKVTTLGVFTREKHLIRQGKPLPSDATHLEHALYAVAVSPTESLKPLMEAGLPIAQTMNDRLREHGLLVSRFPSVRNVLASLIMAGPLLLGLTKIVIGISRDKPVGHLVVLCIFTGIATILFFAVRKRLTSAGKAALQTLQASFEPARTSAASLTPAQLAMTVGLFGVGMLAVGPLSSIYALTPRRYEGGGCSSSSSGCGGGGCGGGGCGGGGCGGCGS